MKGGSEGKMGGDDLRVMVSDIPCGNLERQASRTEKVGAGLISQWDRDNGDYGLLLVRVELKQRGLVMSLGGSLDVGSAS